MGTNRGVAFHSPETNADSSVVHTEIDERIAENKKEREKEEAKYILNRVYDILRIEKNPLAMHNKYTEYD